jgi:hypothetical protein
LPVGDFKLFPVNNPTSFVAVVSACHRNSLVQAQCDNLILLVDKIVLEQIRMVPFVVVVSAYHRNRPMVVPSVPLNGHSVITMTY